MRNNKTFVIIPARGGSKGLPGKNIKLFNNKPLIAHTIEAALKVNSLNNIVVSTDDEQIAKISRDSGAAVPFLRPKELATDSSSIIDAVVHLIDYYKKDRIDIGTVILLQPTSPLRNSFHIEGAFNMYKNNNFDSVVSVCQAVAHPLILRKIDEDGCLREILPQTDKHMRRQDADKIYQINGAIYITSVESLLKTRSFHGNKVLPYIMSQEDSIDIDTELDFKLAELIMKEKKYV